jgi:hypothetical protein
MSFDDSSVLVKTACGGPRNLMALVTYFYDLLVINIQVIKKEYHKSLLANANLNSRFSVKPPILSDNPTLKLFLSCHLQSVAIFTSDWGICESCTT